MMQKIFFEILLLEFWNQISTQENQGQWTAGALPETAQQGWPLQEFLGSKMKPIISEDAYKKVL